MKISSLTTERAADVLCMTIPHIANITGDKSLMDALAQRVGKNSAPAEIMAFGAQKVSMIVPLLLKDHRDDLFGLLAVLNEQPVETVAKQNVLKTVAQVREMMQDKDLMDFFKSWRQEDAKEQ